MIEEFCDLQMSPPISLQGSLLRLRLHSSVAVAVSVISCEFFVLPRLTGPTARRPTLPRFAERQRDRNIPREIVAE
jgi:hypothetical protein